VFPSFSADDVAYGHLPNPKHPGKLSLRILTRGVQAADALGIVSREPGVTLDLAAWAKATQNVV